MGNDRNQLRPVVPLIVSADSIRLDLSEYMKDLNIVEDEEKIIVMPKRFLGHKKFNSVSSLMEEMGGSYVSDGRKSHFIIKKKLSQ
jgi:hypothetical protein